MADNLKVESHKLVYDFQKHLTTLSAGSALLVITLVEKLFPKPEGTWMIAVALCGFLGSLLCGLAAMAMIGMNVGKTTSDGSFPEEDASTFIYAGGFGAGSFFLGIFSTVMFALKNFF